MLQTESLESQWTGRRLTWFDQLRNLAGPPGRLPKRMLRLAFFVLSDAVQRLPGFSAVSQWVHATLPGAWTWFNVHETAYRKLARRPRFSFDADQLARMRSAPIHRVHQFHSGSATGDAITNSMFLLQRTLRDLGYESEIFVEHRDPELATRLLDVADLPSQAGYILIVHHSIGYDICDRIAALPVNKILMYHNITPPELLGDAPVLAQYAKLGLAQLDLLRDHVICALADSEYNARELRARGYQSAHVCPFLFDIDKLLAQTDPQHDRIEHPFTVLSVGRINGSKGQADLVDAFAEFRKRWPAPARLVLVGRLAPPNDGYMKQIRRRIAQRGVSKAVIFTGVVSDEELREWYRQADLYVSLSLHEGFGVPLVEAMAGGVPVIAWPAGAVAETLGGAATLLDSREPATVADVMLQLAGNQDVRSEQVSRQYSSLDRFRLGSMLPTLRAALASAGAARPESEA